MGHKKVLLLALMLLSYLAAAAYAAPPGYYGPCVAMDGLANLTIGPNGQISARFLCEHTGAIDRIVQQYENTSPRLYGRYGRPYQMGARTDDGTASHLPSNSVLWTTIDTNPTKAASGTVIQWFNVVHPYRSLRARFTMLFIPTSMLSRKPTTYLMTEYIPQRTLPGPAVLHGYKPYDPLERSELADEPAYNAQLQRPLCGRIYSGDGLYRLDDSE